MASSPLPGYQSCSMSLQDFYSSSSFIVFVSGGAATRDTSHRTGEDGKEQGSRIWSTESLSHKDGGLLRPLLLRPRVKRPANLFLRSEGPCLPSSSHSEIMLPLQGSAGPAALVAVVTEDGDIVRPL